MTRTQAMQLQITLLAVAAVAAAHGFPTGIVTVYPSEIAVCYLFRFAPKSVLTISLSAQKQSDGNLVVCTDNGGTCGNILFTNNKCGSFSSPFAHGLSSVTPSKGATCTLFV